MNQTILCTADFTDYSSKVVQYASDLALSLNADLLLYHSSYVPVTVSGAEFPDGKKKAFKGSHEIQEQLIDLCNSLKAEAKRKGKSSKCDYIKDEGFNIGGINEVVQQRRVSLIITGAPSANTSAGEGVFSGDTVLSLLENSECPVLVLPVDSTLPKVNKVVYSIDISGFKFQTINQTLDLLKPLRPDISFLYFTEEADSKEIAKFDAAKTAILENIYYENTQFRLITASNLIKGLNEYADKNQADMVVMATYKRNLLDKLVINKSHTKKMVQSLRVPVLIMKGQHY
ncbi:universal stress protein [Cytophagaceae bacterium ABcell3]|nr:universal stress protein [Cytophagaceae bacterium ABcell3]